MSRRAIASFSATGLFPAAAVALLLAAPATAQIPAHAVALNPTAGLIEPRLARSGDVLHAVGREIVGAGNYRVRYGRSPDRGRSWPLRELVLATTATPGNLVVDGNDVHVGVDERSFAPHIVSSHDGGLTWLAPLRIEVPATGVFTRAPLLHAAGGVVNAVWLASTPTGPGVFTRRSTDGGATWSATATRLDVGAPTAPPTIQKYDDDLRVFGDGTAVHVFWCRIIEQGPSQQEYHACHQRSLDGGASWLPAVTVVATTTQIPLTGEAVQPAAMGAGAVFVASAETLHRSVDQGASWQVVAGLSLGAASRRIYDIAADGADVFAFARQFSAIATNASADAGTTWRASPYLIPLSVSNVPLQAAVAGGALFLSVFYPTTPFVSPAVVQSDDRCDNWRLLASGATLAFADADGGVAVAYGPGTITLHAFVVEGHTTLGQGSPGTGGLVPTLRGGGLVGLGRTFALQVGDALPGAPVGVLFAFGPTTAIPFGPATLYLAQPLGPVLLTTSAAATAALAIGVPASPSLAGLRLASQAFVLDAGVAAGFAATRAVESWVR